MDAKRCDRARRTRLRLLALTCGVLLAAANGASAATAHHAPLARAAACPGRVLLTCDERLKAFGDDITWDHAFVLDLELFETSLPLHLNNPALRQFWRFETATAGARSVYEYIFQNTVTDDNFEAIAAVPSLPQPAVAAHGIISRRTAGVLSSLMRAEQDEVLNLQALDTSLNRATTASFLRGRSDWVKWQMATAAGFARRTARAISRVIAAQRSVTQVLVHQGLLFGVGSVDLKLGQRQVKKYGLAPSVRATMQGISMDALTIAFCINAFEKASFGQLSFSLSRFLSSNDAIHGEQGFRGALNALAARVPPASQPPS
jgi:hypothetical protein